MLRVPTVVRPSPIQGVGLFSAGEIPAGTVIWEFTPGVDWRIPPQDLARFPEPLDVGVGQGPAGPTVELGLRLAVPR